MTLECSKTNFDQLSCWFSSHGRNDSCTETAAAGKRKGPKASYAQQHRTNAGRSGYWAGDTAQTPITLKQYNQKMQQHQLLCQMLTQHGYKVRLLPLPLGFAGTLYKSNMAAPTELGISRAQAKVMRQLRIHGMTCPHNILKERRYLESSHNSVDTRPHKA